MSYLQNKEQKKKKLKKNKLMGSYTSFSTEPFEIKLNKEIDVNFDIMLCAIMTLCYNSKQWVGKIIEQNDENEDYSINFMHPDESNKFILAKIKR